MLRILATVFLILSLLSGCAYFNTFYLAKKNFNDAERIRNRDKGVVSSETKKFYTEAINWSYDLLERYRDSKYVDDSLYIIGVSNYYQEQYFEARIKFEELLNGFPESYFAPKAQYYMAKCLAESEQEDNAKIIFAELMNSDNRDVSGLAGVAIAEINYRNEEWDELLVAAERVIDLDPNDEERARAVYYKGEALYHLERYEECANSLRAITKQKVESELRFKINSLLALTIAKIGNFNDAMTYLTAMQNKGEFKEYAPRIRFQIGKIYEMQGDDENAIDTFTKLAGDFPDSLSAKEAWYSIGILLLKDLSKVDEAQDGFKNVKQGKAKTTSSWFVEAELKSNQIDSLKVKLERINRNQDDPETLARLRFSLAETYTYSFDHPDSALTQYRLIMEELPGSSFAIKSEYFLGLHELRAGGSYSEETEKSLKLEIIEKYPESDFTQDLKVTLGLIEKPPDVRALLEAELSRMSGDDSEMYLELFSQVIDTFPGTKSAYRARFLLAYYSEHDVGDWESAADLYQALADETPNANSEEFVKLAQEKMKFFAEEEKILEEIGKSIAYYESVIDAIESGESRTEAAAEITPDAGSVESSGVAYTGFRKLRERNARIRSRYYSH